MDYAYLGPEGSQVTLLVCKCKRTGCLAATQVPAKGVDAYALSFIVGWLRGLGWKRIVMRSDNERALLSLLRAAAMSLEGVEVVEQACPEGDHAANGLAEVAVREVKAQTRVLKSHLEQRLGRPLEWTEPLATWLVRHAANCLTRYRVQADGRTPHQRRTGRSWKRQVVEFGEKAVFLPVAARREERVASDAERMTDGIFVGHHERTGAALFLSDKGLLRGTRVQRKTADQQWDNEHIRKCRGVPWKLLGEDQEAAPAPPAAAAVVPGVGPLIAPPQVKRRYILRQDVARYGPTPGCQACTALSAGAQRVAQRHTEECRKRMDELMQRDEDAVVQQRLHADRLRRDAGAQASAEEAPAGDAASSAPRAADAGSSAPAAGEAVSPAPEVEEAVAPRAGDAASPAPAAGDAEMVPTTPRHRDSKRERSDQTVRATPKRRMEEPRGQKRAAGEPDDETRTSEVGAREGTVAVPRLQEGGSSSSELVRPPGGDAVSSTACI